jgi:hypothetical protein
LALLIVVVFGLVIFGHVLTVDRNERPPDVAAVAKSATVVAADRTAVAEVDTRLAALPQAGAWLVPGPTAILDDCQSLQDGDWSQSWTQVTCGRMATAFFYFNGDFEEHMQAWDGELRASGWGAVGDPMDQAESYYELYGDKPAPQDTSRTYLATDLPRSGGYCILPKGDEGKVCLTITWAERISVNQDQVESAAFAKYQYIAIVEMTDVYYDPADAPPTTLPPLDPNYTPCYSGSNTCN